MDPFLPVEQPPATRGVAQRKARRSRAMASAEYILDLIQLASPKKLLSPQITASRSR